MRELQIIAALEQLALKTREHASLATSAVERVAAHLGVERCAVLAYEDDGERLRFLGERGWPAVLTRRPTLQAESLGCRPRVRLVPGPSEFCDQGAFHGVGVPIAGHDEPFGLLTVHARGRRRFGAAELAFLEAVASVLAVAVERSQAEASARRLALHDSLTGLPNHTLLDDRLVHALASARRHGRQLSVLVLDVDDFKQVNDGLGHSSGDELLRALARRLAENLRAEDTLARLDGDSFAILLHEVPDAAGAIKMAKRVLERLEQPLVAGAAGPLRVSASIGITTVSGDAGAVAPELVRDAELAMHQAKREGRGLAVHFAPQMHASALRRLKLGADLQRAIAEQQFEVHYQPIVELAGQRVVGVEALVRWRHPELGLLAPGAFIELAEETGAMVAIDEFVLLETCRQLKRLDEIQPALHAAVNLSPSQLASPALLDQVRAALSECGLAPERLVLEISERVLMHDDERLRERLTELRELGVRLAVDDFGTGYSALGALLHVPVDILKIDKSFVDGLGDSSTNDELVSGIIELAHKLRMQTVAEGVETPDQARLLASLRSELGQGFHFARPVPAAKLAALLGTQAAQLA